MPDTFFWPVHRRRGGEEKQTTSRTTRAEGFGRCVIKTKKRAPKTKQRGARSHASPRCLSFVCRGRSDLSGTNQQEEGGKEEYKKERRRLLLLSHSSDLSLPRRNCVKKSTLQKESSRRRRTSSRRRWGMASKETEKKNDDVILFAKKRKREKKSVSNKKTGTSLSGIKRRKKNKKGRSALSSSASLPHRWEETTQIVGKKTTKETKPCRLRRRLCRGSHPMDDRRPAPDPNEVAMHRPACAVEAAIKKSRSVCQCVATEMGRTHPLQKCVLPCVLASLCQKGRETKSKKGGQGLSKKKREDLSVRSPKG